MGLTWASHVGRIYGTHKGYKWANWAKAGAGQIVWVRYGFGDQHGHHMESPRGLTVWAQTKGHMWAKWTLGRTW